ncbi:MAG: hypothetical protein LBH32_05430 [Dysgonamonadaceae bacterium]|jgi:hypothetical protein|nr:hypothetical protein [Dysgonamonadaceae bacterium]
MNKLVFCLKGMTRLISGLPNVPCFICCIKRRKSPFYCLLEEFEFIGAKTEYDHCRKTYCYLSDFELIIDIRVQTGDEERKKFACST